MATKSTAIKKGDQVKIDYTGTLDDGTVFDSSKHEGHSHPLEFEVGSGRVIKGFDEAVIGMKKGEEKEFAIKPEDAYGQPDPTRVIKFPRDKLPNDAELKAGAIVALGTPNGQQIPAKIITVSDTEVTMDINHPLAGQTLHFKIKVI